MNDLTRLLIDRLLSWPIASIVICLIFRKWIGALLKEIASFVARASHMTVKRGDTTVEAMVVADASFQVKKATDDVSPNLGAISTITSNRASEADDLAHEREAALDYGKGVPSVRYREEGIQIELKRLRFFLSENETGEMLIRQLAMAQSLAFFERTYRLIYGSQIQALDFINTNGVVLASTVELVFFDTARAMEEVFYGETTFDGWLSFLLAQSLVARENESLAISVQGRDFLVWMVNAGLTHTKSH